MFKRSTPVFVALGLLAAPPQSSFAQDWGIRPNSFAEVLQRVTAMPSDAGLQRRAQAHGLRVVNVMWEDTGRSLGSALGPNISDLSLQVHAPQAGGRRAHLLPVIRPPNFSDKTADVTLDKLWVEVGNQHGGQATPVPLSEVLGNLSQYLSDPNSLPGDGNFLAPRDSHLLVSAQHVFVPLPKSGKVEFNPVLFNYQSAVDSPAVMTLLVTREGTSATIIENRPGERSSVGWGQQLYFNHAGQKTLFTAERRSAVARRIEQGMATKDDEGALEEGANMMMIIQIPLKHRNRGVLMGMGSAGAGSFGGAPETEAKAKPRRSKRQRSTAPRSDVEQAVLGHGEDLGPFHEMRGKKLTRDPRFPIRVTVQFYKATSNGVVSDTDLAEVAEGIRQVYASGDYVGSLVVPKHRQRRPTDWTRPVGYERCEAMNNPRRRARCRNRLLGPATR